MNTPLARQAGLPDSRARPFQPFHLQSPGIPPSSLCHATPQRHGCPRGSDFALGMQARQTCPAESSSSSYGLVVHLLLLPTPPPGDAVAFSFRPESVCLKRTFTSLTTRALRRTYHRRQSGDVFKSNLPCSGRSLRIIL